MSGNSEWGQTFVRSNGFWACFSAWSKVITWMYLGFFK